MNARSPAVLIDQRLEQALADHQAGRRREAERGYLETLQQYPEHPVALLFLGVIRHDERNFDEAARLMERSILLNPAEARAYNHLGLTLLARGDSDGAIRNFETAVRLKPRYADALNNLGSALQAKKRHAEAEKLFRDALAARPGYVPAHYNLGLLQFELRDFENARTQLRRTLELDPRFHKAHHQLGLTAENLGRFAEAAGHFEAALAAAPDYVPALSALLALRDYEPSEAMMAQATERAARDNLRGQRGFRLCHALAKRFERRREFDTAFKYMEMANTRRARGTKYEPQRVDESFARYLGVFTRELVRKHAVHGSSSERPVFVLGMPRTGTTLTEQILSRHPGIFGAGELPDLPRIANRLPAVMSAELGQPQRGFPLCLENLSRIFVRAMTGDYEQVLAGRSADAARVLDKNPFNFLNVGLIAILFPRARIIHCTRNPLDVGISCYTEIFDLAQDFTTDFGNFAHYYGHHHRLMQHWRRELDLAVFEVPYESLVANPERVTRGIVEFCGLPWDDACLDHQQTERAVLTPSKWQVRQPIYGSSVERWRNYAQHLGPLERALREQGVVLDAP